MVWPRLSLSSFLGPKRPSPTPRLIFNHGIFTVDGAMLAILCSLFVMFGAIAGLLLVPEYKTILIFALLAEITVILAVIGKTRSVLSVFLLYKTVVFGRTVVHAVVNFSEIFPAEKTSKMFSTRLFKNIPDPDSLNHFVSMTLWIAVVLDLLAIVFTYLHTVSLIETIRRIDEIANRNHCTQR